MFVHGDLDFVNFYSTKPWTIYFFYAILDNKNPNNSMGDNNFMRECESFIKNENLFGKMCWRRILTFTFNMNKRWANVDLDGLFSFFMNTKLYPPYARGTLKKSESDLIFVADSCPDYFLGNIDQLVSLSNERVARSEVEARFILSSVRGQGMRCKRVGLSFALVLDF